MFLSNHPIHVDMESIVDQLSTEKQYLKLNPHHLFSDLLINRMFPMQEMQKQDYITDKDELMVMVLRLSERYVYLFDPINSKVFITGNAPEGQMSDLIENFRQWQSVPTGDVVAKIQGDTLPFGKQFYYCDFKRNEKADVLVNYLNLPVDVDENTRAKYFNHILGKQDGLLKEYLKLNSNISDFGSFEKITGNVHSYYLSFQTDYDSAAKVINELLSHINALATTKSNKKDLKLWTGQYLRLENCKYESNSSKACLLNSINTENLPNDYFSSRMKVVKKTKGGKLKKFVSATINPDEMQFLVIGNKEKIIKQFDKSGLGTMKEVSLSGKIINN
jgi:zinc protease